MDQARPADDVLDLVGLQRPDEVPVDIGKQPVLAQELLDAVLAEVARAGIHGHADLGDAHRLGHDDDRDLVGTAP